MTNKSVWVETRVIPSGRVSRSLGFSRNVLCTFFFFGCAAPIAAHEGFSCCRARALERVGLVVRALRLSCPGYACAFNRGVSMIPTSDPAPSLLADVVLCRRASGAVLVGKFPRGWQGPPRAGPPVAWLVVSECDGMTEPPKASLQAPLLSVHLSVILFSVASIP